MAKLKISTTPAIKKLEIFTKRLVGSAFLGGYRSVFKGKGLEFENYRPYTTADDSKTIDWKATLRANEILVKEFGEERELHVFLLIDVGSTMLFGSTSKLKNEYAAELASSLCFAVLQSLDAVGFAIFSNKVIKKYPPIKDNKQLYFLLKSLTDIRSYGGQSNLGKAVESTVGFLKPSAILIIISDFLGFEKNWDKSLMIAAKKFDVVGIMVRDRRDISLPPIDRMILLEDTVSGKQLLIQTNLVREAYRRYAAKQENMARESFKRAGAGFISLSTDKDFSRPVMDYFNLRLKKFV